MVKFCQDLPEYVGTMKSKSRPALNGTMLDQLHRSLDVRVVLTVHSFNDESVNFWMTGTITV